MRRLVCCCDGTWQSALFQENPRKLTNIARLHASIQRQDSRQDPPIEQIKLYIPGLGTGEEIIGGVVSGALGQGMLEKVREAYYWLMHNYETGDEIHLYGFSRGGYLARLLSNLICSVGVLDPFSSRLPEIFSHLTAKRDLGTKWGRRQQQELSELLSSDDIQQRKREQINARPGGFLVQVFGVFETVPLFHLHTLSPEHDLLPIRNPFSLSDSNLEPEIASAFQGLAIAEDRPSYTPVILRHDPKVQGQELLQVWFPGGHSDCGGGIADHDLATLSLQWLVGQVQDKIALDIDFISQMSEHASAPWGSHKPHEGFARSLHHKSRHLPHGTDATTFQHFHQSLLEQDPLDVPSSVRPLLEISDHPLFLPLTPFEQHLKDTWPIQPAVPVPAPLPLSDPSPPLDSPRLVTEAPTVFHASPRDRTETEESKKHMIVADSLEGHSWLRQGFRTALMVEKGLVKGFEQLEEKARGAGDLPSESRGR